MPREEGVVIRIVPDGAVVCVKKTDACHSCPSSGICHTGGGGERQVVARNPVGAREGQRVEIEIRDGLLVRASFIVYILPIVALLLGALCGRWAIHSFGIPLSDDTGAVAGGLLCMAAVFVFIKIKGRSRQAMEKYQPTIIKTK
jgi:sigma-E factor negative regulatory protein RseC